MQVNYELQLDDLRAWERFWKSRHTTPSRFWGWSLVRLSLGLFLLPGIVGPLRFLESPAFKSAWKASGPVALWPLGIVVIPLLALALAWFGAPLLQPLSFRASPFYKKQIALVIEQGGLRGETLTPWSQMRAVEETPAHIFIPFGDNRVLIIPRRAFASDFEATQFAARCRDFHRQVKTTESIKAT